MSRYVLVVVVTLSLLAHPSSGQLAIQAERIASGLDAPVFVTMPPGDTDRLFIVEQNNHRILVLDRTTGTINGTPFLTVPSVATEGEQGLLGLAFHPNYAVNGFFYVDFTAAGDGRTVVRRYHVSADPDVADASSGTTVLEIAQPQANHNGGWIAFGPDGYLYVATGDGGNGDDQGAGHTEPGGNAQDIAGNLLGKMLRVDIDGDDFPADPNRNYAIPASNPFVGVTGDDEIWAYGLRNPWRNSFDRLTGDLYIADVGQNRTEEIDVQPAASSGGENYGWRLREGTQATPSGVGGARPPSAIDPIYEYQHGSGALEGFAVTGGYVYRGPIAALQGKYLFGDFANDRVWMLDYDGSPPNTFDGTNYGQLVDLTDAIFADVGTIDAPSSFGEDPAGNVFVVDYGGEIFAITGATTTFGDGDRYKFYKVKGNGEAAPFVSFGAITLTDRFRSADYDVLKPVQLGTPADQNGAGTIDAITHLVEYKVKTSAGAIDTTISVVNQCNNVGIEVGKPVSLLVPANADLVSVPAAPDPLAHDVDHYVCYHAKPTRRSTRGRQVDLVDSFDGGTTRRYDLVKVTKFCTPADKAGSPVYLAGTNAGAAKPITPATRKDANDDLLCYRLKLARNTIAQSGCGAASLGDRGTPIDPRQPKHVRVIGANTNDQFGSESLDTVKEMELCIPSVVP